jgi:hypothetical protein
MLVFVFYALVNSVIFLYNRGQRPEARGQRPEAILVLFS